MYPNQIPCLYQGNKNKEWMDSKIKKVVLESFDLNNCLLKFNVKIKFQYGFCSLCATWLHTIKSTLSKQQLVTHKCSISSYILA